MTRRHRPARAHSLQDWAERHGARLRGRRCWVCLLPERPQIDAALRARTPSVSLIARWLREERGYGELATRGRLESHRLRHVNT